jgi:hypothetical protein
MDMAERTKLQPAFSQKIGVDEIVSVLAKKIIVMSLLNHYSVFVKTL